VIQIPLTYDGTAPFWYNALVLYSAALALVIVAIWIYTEVTTRRTYRALGKQFLWRCVFCGYTYLDEAAESISQCPRCGSFNSIDDRHARFVKTHTSAAATPLESGAPSKGRRNPSRRKRPQQRRRGPRRR